MKKEIKKINTVHKKIDELFKGNTVIDIPKEQFYEIKESNKIETKSNIKTAVEEDLHSNDMNMINDKSSSDLLRAMEILHNPENLESNTILTNNQVIALSIINYLAQAYDINFFKVFIKTFPRYRISGDDGRGRKEMIEIANAIRRDKEEEHQRFMEILGRR